MEVTVIRSRRKTLSLRVEREGEVVVHAPTFVSEAEIERFVERNRAWIGKRLIFLRAVPSLADGSRLSIAGKEVLIGTGKRATLKGEMLLLPEERREEALIRFLKSFSRERMTRLTEEISARFGFSFQAVHIGSARGRWGSCSSKGSISYTFRTAFLPDPLAEYIAAHELAHTRQMNHSAAFWAEVGRMIPDYVARRRALKSYIWAMNFL